MNGCETSRDAALARPNRDCAEPSGCANASDCGGGCDVGYCAHDDLAILNGFGDRDCVICCACGCGGVRVAI